MNLRTIGYKLASFIDVSSSNENECSFTLVYLSQRNINSIINSIPVALGFVCRKSDRQGLQ